MERKAGLLLLITAANFFITYVTGVLLARSLGVERFDDYAVAALTWILGGEHGALGAALAYGVPVAALYLTFMVVAMGHLRALMASTEAVGRSLTEEDDEEFAL